MKLSNSLKRSSPSLLFWMWSRAPEGFHPFAISRGLLHNHGTNGHLGLLVSIF